MIELGLTVADLAETSFAFSPLLETTLSLWAWTFPGRHALHLRWLAAARQNATTMDTRLLDVLVGPRRQLPRFLTPRPVGPTGDIDTELAAVARVNATTVAVDFLAIYAGEALPPVLRAGVESPERLRDLVVATLREYWLACLKPWWPRIRAVLEADIVYRSRQLAVGGASALFADLDPLVVWRDGLLRVDRYPGQRQHVQVDGRGLPLVPTLFARGANVLLRSDQAATLIYPARGRATVWEPTAPPTPGGLRRLLGRSRAELLVLLQHPATTTELALRLGVTPAAISQHLQVLYAARLLTRARSGRMTLYSRTPLGDDLVG